MLNLFSRFLPAEYLWKVAGKKIVYSLGKLVASWLAYANASGILATFGISIDAKMFDSGLAIFTMGALEWLHDILRIKFPESKWL